MSVMADFNIDPAELMADAIRIVKACSSAQVGDHHAMADAEVMDQMERILSEPNLCYAVVKTFSATVAAFASSNAEEVLGTNRGAKHEALAIEFIRAGVDNLGFNIQSRPNEE